MHMPFVPWVGTMKKKKKKEMELVQIHLTHTHTHTHTHTLYKKMYLLISGLLIIIALM